MWSSSSRHRVGKPENVFDARIMSKLTPVFKSDLPTAGCENEDYPISAPTESMSSSISGQIAQDQVRNPKKLDFRTPAGRPPSHRPTASALADRLLIGRPPSPRPTAPALADRPTAPGPACRPGTDAPVPHPGTDRTGPGRRLRRPGCSCRCIR